MAITVAARSKGGWLGFDPGVTQAANVGLFRLRWVQHSDVARRSNCREVAAIRKSWLQRPAGDRQRLEQHQSPRLGLHSDISARFPVGFVRGRVQRSTLMA
jgi:hypothetical protein